MKGSIILFFFVVVFQNIGFGQKKTWKSEDLLRIELETWFDLFSISSNWVNSTNDDANIQFSRNGLAGIGGAWWPVYINGVQVETEAWGTNSLHIIPFDISQLDSVVIIEKPMVYEGVFTEKGGVFLYMKDNEEGLRSEGSISFGSNSGDPGPYAYTEHISPNSERIGPFINGQISYRDNKFGIKVGGSHTTHPLTDNLLAYARLKPFKHTVTPTSQVKIIKNSGFLKLNYSGEVFNHEILVGTSEAEDFIYTEVYTSEVPVSRNFSYASIQGNGEILKDLSFSYQAGYNQQRLENYPNKDDLWVSWNQDITSLKTSINQKFQRGTAQIGLEYKFFSLKDDLSGNRLNMNNISSVYFIDYQLSKKINVFYSGKLSRNEDYDLKNHTGLNYKISNTNTFYMEGSYSQRSPAEDNSIWYWIAKKGFGSDTLSAFDDVQLTYNPIYKDIRFGWKTNKENLLLSVSAVFSKHVNEYFADIDLNLNEKGEIFPESFNFINNYSADFFRIPIRINLNHNKTFQEFRFTWSRQVSGNRKFFSMLPKHKFIYSINWKPESSLKIWARLQIQSRTSWANLESLDGKEIRLQRFGTVSTYSYDTNFNTRALLDLGFKKYLWEEKLAFSIDLRNITDQFYRKNPLSREHRFTFFLKTSFLF